MKTGLNRETTKQGNSCLFPVSQFFHITDLMGKCFISILVYFYTGMICCVTVSFHVKNTPDLVIIWVKII